MAIYELSDKQKEEIKRKITHLLQRKREIILAYLYGSFTEGNFRDIDVASLLD